MKCSDWFEGLYQILDKDVDESVWKDVEDHMKHCTPCWDKYEFEKHLKERVQSSCRKESCTEALRNRVKALFEKY